MRVEEHEARKNLFESMKSTGREVLPLIEFDLDVKELKLLDEYASIMKKIFNYWNMRGFLK